MKILLCGAKDISEVSEDFEILMHHIGATPAHFLNATIIYSNYTKWETNSEKSVEGANAVVFVILKEHGEITWRTEYLTTIKNGKPFILLCEAKTFDRYLDIKSHADQMSVVPGSAISKVHEVLDLLNSEQKTIVPFRVREFQNVLRGQLSMLFERALDELEARNKKGSILHKIKNKEDLHAAGYQPSASDKEILKATVLNTYENKALRKDILDFIAEYKILDHDEIIILINDDEQGIWRKTIELLPKLLDKDADYSRVMEAVVGKYKETADIGIPRRFVTALCQLDIKYAVANLSFLLFPPKNIVVPRTVLEWLNDSINSYCTYLHDMNFREQVLQLAQSAFDYDKTSPALASPYKQLLEKIEECLRGG